LTKLTEGDGPEDGAVVMLHEVPLVIFFHGSWGG
jgi:hypothetical protein